MTTRYPQAILIRCDIPWDANEQLMEGVFRQEVSYVLAARSVRLEKGMRWT